MRLPRLYFQIGLLTAIMLLPLVATAQQSQTISRDDQLEAYRERAEFVVDHFAYRIDSTDVSRGGYIDIMAKLDRGVDMSWVESRLDTLMANVRGDTLLFDLDRGTGLLF